MTTQQYLQELAVEKRVLKGLDSLILPQRIYMPPDMLWEIWWFIPKSVKQVFIDLRQQRLTKMFLSGSIHEMLYQIPLSILLKFIQFGTPNKYYISTPTPIYGTSIQLLDGTSIYCKSSDIIDWIKLKYSDFDKRMYIISEIINIP